MGWMQKDMLYALQMFACLSSDERMNEAIWHPA